MSGPQDNETLLQHVSRVCRNSFTKCMGLAQTADEVAKIKYTEFQIETRKKTFGVTYLNLLKEQASPTALQSCIDSAVSDIAVLADDIVKLQDEIDRVNNVTKEKIVAKPGGAGGGAGSAAAYTGTPTVTTANTTVTTAPTADTTAGATPVSTLVPTTTDSKPASAPEDTKPSDDIDMQEVSLEQPKP